MCNYFDRVATKALRMEQQNKPIAENIHFADLINAVGNELIMCGKKLQDSSNEISMACHSTDERLG